LKASKLIQQLLKETLAEVHTTLPGIIESYDPKKLRASVIILAKKTIDGVSYTLPPIIECPVQVFKAGPFIIRPPYKKGDVVKIDFSEKGLDNLLVNGAPTEPGYTRSFSYDDAIVSGGLKLENQPDTPDEYLDGLYIRHTGTNAKIIITGDGNTAIVEAGTIKLGEGAAPEGVPLGTSLKEWLDSHTHPYSWGHEGVAGNTGAPNEASPDPSSKVRVE
jgi:hypothetical protein